MTAVVTSCNTIDDEQVPSFPVNLALSPLSVWQKYGVSVYGESREFIKSERIPSDFGYLDRTLTGFGGVLLVMGFNPYSGEDCVPMAYDLSCPVERQADIRVKMVAGDPLPEARCPHCGSTYDVVQRGGSPTGGVALKRQLGLRRYDCYQATGGGYVIAN